MAGPWEEYQGKSSPEAKPWEEFGATQEKAKSPGAIRKAGDLAVGLVGGAIGATKALTDVAGAGNAASNFLDSANKDIDSLLSPQAQADQQEIAAHMSDAKPKGSTWKASRQAPRHLQRPQDSSPPRRLALPHHSSLRH